VDRRFWSSALLAAGLTGVVLAGAVPLFLKLEPRGGLRLLTPVELWLLSVFTLGALGVLLGSSVGLMGGTGRGAREGLRELRERADRLERATEGAGDEPGEARPAPASPRAEGDDGGKERADAGWWVAATGAFLLAVYALGWLAAGRG
jgi:hypothetical protein